MIPNKLYDAVKWIVIIFLPAAAALLSVLNGAWAWGLPIEAILTTFSGVEAFLGALLGISTIEYNKSTEVIFSIEDDKEDGENE